MSDPSSPPSDTLARTFRAVIDAQAPAPDDWDLVRQRVTADDRGGTVTLAPAGTKRRRSRHLLAVAAVVVAVSGLAATIVIATNRDDEPQVRTGAAPATEPPATGWYIPEGLPAGWTLDAVELTRQDDACPCRVALWANADRSRSLSLTRTRVPAGTTSPPADQMAETPVPVDLGAVDGARVADASGGWFLEWYEGDSWFTVSGYGIDRSQAEAVGRAFVADGSLASSPVPGLDLVGSRETDQQSQPNVYVKVELTTPTGQTNHYRLSTPATFGPSHPSEPVPLPGQALPLYRELPWRPGTQVAPVAAGHWPGADVQGAAVESPIDPTKSEDQSVGDEAEARTLLGALRPATAAQWQAYVASAREHDPRLDDAPTLESLRDLPAD